MYLPVIMLNRFGWPGFIAFAIPNVLGCSAMAFIVQDSQRSERLRAQHRLMMTLFSLVTVAYQVFFVAWLMELAPSVSLPWWMPMIVALVVYGLGLVFAFANDRDWLALAVVTYVISLGAFIAAGFGGLQHHVEATQPLERLWWLMPTLCFGFVLCPYLDLTFHRAVRNSARPRVSFTVFGIMFAAMLLLTVLLWFNPSVWTRRMAAMLALGHFFAQLIFTIGAHLREMRGSPVLASSNWLRGVAMALPAAAAATLIIARLVIDRPETGEWVYLTFLGCYGLVFPAYVLVAMASGRPLLTAAEWAMLAGLIAIGTPMYARGFLFNDTRWLVPPVALALLWFAIRRRK